MEISSHIPSESPSVSNKDESSVSMNGSPRRDYVSTMEIPLFQVELAHVEKNTLEIPQNQLEDNIRREVSVKEYQTVEVPIEETQDLEIKETPKEEADIASTFEFVELPQENAKLNSNLVEQLEKVAFEAFKEPAHEYHKPNKGYTDWELVEELEKQRREVLLARERVNAARQKLLERAEAPKTPNKPFEIKPLHEARENLDSEKHRPEPLETPEIERPDRFKILDDTRRNLEWMENPKPAYRPDQMKPLHEARGSLETKPRSENMVNLSELRPLPREKEKSASFNDEIVKERIRNNLDRKKGLSTQSLYSQKSDEIRSSSPISSSNASTYDNVIPTRPRRTKNVENAKPSIDVGTKLLLDRSKMLHDKKKDFMEDRMTGSNPYIKKMIQIERRQRDSLSDDDELAPLENYRPKTYSHFPSSRAVETRRYENRYRSPATHTTAAPTTSVSPSTSHGITSYFKRSPPVSPTLPARRERETSKESCTIS